MAEVFRAKHIGVGGFEKIVAIKRILPHFSNNDEFITMFNEEAKVSAQLSHQNIVQIYEFGMVEKSYYIAMEYVDGLNLNDLLIKYAEMNTTIPVNVTLAIIRDACRGLDYAHRKKGFDNKPLNIVHRDISPKNVMISFDGGVKVMDFGIAKAASRDYETRTGVIKGKISYLSPEQVQGARLDKRSDLFSLGIVFYEMLTGTKCFKGESDFSILFKIKNSEFEQVNVVNPAVDLNIAPIVLKSLAQNREDRFQSCEEMAKEIEKYLSSHNIDPSETDIAGFMQEIEPSFRDKASAMVEYFPEEGEMTKGAVFQLGEDGQIPAEIETMIAEENLGIDSSRIKMPDTKIPDEGTQLVSMQPVIEQAQPQRSLFLYGLVGVVLLALIVAGLALTGIFSSSRTNVDYTGTATGFNQTGGKSPQSGQTFAFSLPVNSDPAGASVMINNNEAKEKTPMTLKGEGAVGEKLEIRVFKDCFSEKTQTITLQKGLVPKKLDVKLSRLVLDVTVDSVPTKAKVYINNQEMGQTPLTMQRIDTCTAYSIRVEKSDYETFSRAEFYFKEPQQTITLEKKQIPGSLTISSTYPVAILSGPKKLADAGPAGITLTLPEGKYSLLALSEKYCIRHNFSVTIEARKTSQENLSFGQLGNVRINSLPYSEVIVNGFELGTTPISSVSLPEGTYEVVWNFVTLGKQKKERLRVRSNIHQEWKGSLDY